MSSLLHKFSFITLLYFCFISLSFCQNKTNNNSGDLSISQIKNDNALIYLKNVSIEVESAVIF